MARAAVATGEEQRLSPGDRAHFGMKSMANPRKMLSAVRELGQKAGERMEELLWWLDQPVDLPWLPKQAAGPKQAEPAKEKSPGPPPFLVSLPPESAGLLVACQRASGPTPPTSVPSSPSSAASDGSSVELGSPGPSRRKVVSVIAPGAGIGANGSVYSQLMSNGRFEVRVVGRSRDAYDRYPGSWPGGSPAPNLQSFGQDVLSQQLAAGSECLVLGSRGGQVVLPQLWQAWGDAAPPALVINGGCAMSLPDPVAWPQRAVTFLLLGGKDFFRGDITPEEYVATARRCVPAGNTTTAILYVSEMEHMPQSDLLALVMEVALEAILAWKASGAPPARRFSVLLAALAREGWDGRMLHTTGPGVWQDNGFGPRKGRT